MIDIKARETETLLKQWTVRIGGTTMENLGYERYLYFAYKKAKHFVTRETSFVEHTEILCFEQKLDENIKRLSHLLSNPKNLEIEIKKMKGQLYFFPKSFSPKGEPRVRPKVAFPFEYQVLWAAVILIIGEWFDTNERVKNTYSICDQNIRKQFDWMVPWSFNGRLKRLKGEAIDSSMNDVLISGYIQYNDSRIYESHQMALKKFETYRIQNAEKMLTCQNEIYKGELDIQEFFPTLKVTRIKEALCSRLGELSAIKKFEDLYFNINEIRETINILFGLEIVYPDADTLENPYKKLLFEYYKKINPGDERSPKVQYLVDFLNDTLPLDLIASNFLSNCTLNHFIDRYIESEIGKENKGKKVSILRYTDDYVILSTEEDTVIQVIENIKKKLGEIGLKYSPQKTLPTNTLDIVNKLDEMKERKGWDEEYYQYVKKKLNLEGSKNLRDINKNEKEKILGLLNMFEINIRPEKVTKSCMKNNRITTNLSTTADTKLQGLSDQELELFTQEMLFYMQSNNDVGELKEETIKIFAAWRLNASYREKTYRMDYNKSELKLFLCTIIEAIQKYPYKMGFYDVYLLTLFKVIEEQESGYEELKSFLIKLPEHVKSQDKISLIYDIYFSAVRTRILNVFAENWYRFNEQQRKELRRIIENTFLVWYADPKIQWTEQYTLYWTLSVLRLRLPIHLCKQDNLKYPVYLNILNQLYEKYIFIIQEPTDEYSKDLYIAVDLFKRGLYWSKQKKEYIFNEVDEIIYSVLKRSITSNVKTADIYSWLSFAQISYEKLDVTILRALDKIVKRDYKTSIRNLDGETHFAVLDFLQYSIKKYFENPQKYTGIVKWIKPTEKVVSNADKTIKDTYYKNYVKTRFRSYAKIRSYYSLSDERLPHLPPVEVNNVGAVPIVDWIFYCQTLPFNLEVIPSKQDVLHPLTEYEFVKLLQHIVLNKPLMNMKRSKYIERDPLFSIKLSYERWNTFRTKGEIESPVRKETKDLDVEVTPEYVKDLFSMLTNRPTHAQIKKHFSMYKWNDLQSYFEMTYYPSTEVASLFVNNLNVHQDFYQKVYRMPLEELPYREVYASTKIDKSIDKWIENYLNKNEKDMIAKKYNRKLELLEIDIDQLRS